MLILGIDRFMSEGRALTNGVATIVVGKWCKEHGPFPVTTPASDPPPIASADCRRQPKARFIGLTLAMVTRVLLLLSIVWMARLTQPLFSLFQHNVSGRDLILLIGGIFLVWKSTHEIHQSLEGEQGHGFARAAVSFSSVIIQIILLDIVFSLDSVITAVGMVNNVPIMIGAVVVAVIFMMFFAGPISGFVDRHPTVKMLALSFLLLIGVTLIAEGFGQHIPKGYIYFAMAFSVFVEVLNIRIRKATTPVKLHRPTLV